MRSAASSSSSGMPRLRASRLPVPDGSRASGVSVPARACAHTRTVPSPPHTMTRSAPSSAASAHMPAPGSSTVVPSHSGSAQPARAMCASTRARIAGKSATRVGL